MKRLENLPDITGEMLGGLHATEQMKAGILRDGAAIRQGGKGVYRAHGWAKTADVRRFAPRIALALTCALVVLLGITVGVPMLMKNPAGDMRITTQTGGDTVSPAPLGQDSALLDVPRGSVNISQRDKPGYRGIWAAASGGNFPLLSVDGRYYRLLTNPTALGSDLQGAALGAVSTFTSEPSLASDGIVSNIVAQGETVYAVQGMSGALVAAQVNGEMRAFQRVSFGNNALKGGEGLGDTLCAGKVIALELTGVGTVTDSETAKALYDTLLNNATLSRSGASETNTSLLIQLSNGITLQMAVRDESVMACGTWSCPEFFEAFAAAVGQ